MTTTTDTIHAARADKKSPSELTGKVAANGLEIYCQQVGHGPDVLLIGGLGDTAESWQFQLDGLADRYRLTACPRATHRQQRGRVHAARSFGARACGEAWHHALRGGARAVGAAARRRARRHR